LLPSFFPFFLPSFLLLGFGFELRALHLESRLLEPHFWCISLWLFCRWGLKNYLPWVALNHDPPNFRLPSS
jgi:hypothetical protein